MSKQNKIVTNYPVNLTVDEVANLSAAELILPNDHSLTAALPRPFLAVIVTRPRTQRNGAASLRTNIRKKPPRAFGLSFLFI